MQEDIVLNSRLQRTTPYLGPNLQQILRKSYLKVLCKSAAGPWPTVAHSLHLTAPYTRRHRYVTMLGI